MAPRKLTEFDKKRLQNIRRNDQKMAALKFHSTASQLSAITKRQRVNSVEKRKPKNDSPVVIRRSLRPQGMPAEDEGITDAKKERNSPRVMGPLSMNDTYRGTGSYRPLLDTILSLQNKQMEIGVSYEVKNQLSVLVKKESAGCQAVKTEKNDMVEGSNYEIKMEKKEEDDGGCEYLRSMKLRKENIAKVMRNDITVVKFLPSNDVKMMLPGTRLEM